MLGRALESRDFLDCRSGGGELVSLVGEGRRPRHNDVDDDKTRQDNVEKKKRG